MNGAVILHISGMCFLVALSLLVWGGLSILVNLQWVGSLFIHQPLDHDQIAKRPSTLQIRLSCTIYI